MPHRVNDKLISWASEVDPQTIAQAEKTARLPIVEGHVALMPDAHVGIGATVGSVIPLAGHRSSSGFGAPTPRSGQRTGGGRLSQVHRP